MLHSFATLVHSGSWLVWIWVHDRECFCGSVIDTKEGRWGNRKELVGLGSAPRGGAPRSRSRLGDGFLQAGLCRTKSNSGETRMKDGSDSEYHLPTHQRIVASGVSR